MLSRLLCVLLSLLVALSPLAATCSPTISSCETESLTHDEVVALQRQIDKELNKQRRVAKRAMRKARKCGKAGRTTERKMRAQQSTFNEKLVKLLSLSSRNCWSCAHYDATELKTALSQQAKRIISLKTRSLSSSRKACGQRLKRKKRASSSDPMLNLMNSLPETFFTCEERVAPPPTPTPSPTPPPAPEVPEQVNEVAELCNGVDDNGDGNIDERVYEVQHFTAPNSFALWFDELFADNTGVRFRFRPGATLEVQQTGFAVMSGTAFIHRVLDGPGTVGEEWEVRLNFRRRGFGPSASGPKIELPALQPPLVTNHWEYFDLVSGRVSRSDGHVLSLSQFPADGAHPFQLGDTANGKADEFGGSSWFTWSSNRTQRTGFGDVNVRADDAFFPGETCDGIDNNCDGRADEGFPDADADGIADCRDQCPNDPLKVVGGICGCGIPDTDSDFDGTPDCADLCPDSSIKTAPGFCGCDQPDTDSDNDGTPNCIDDCPLDANKIIPGLCGCGSLETDSDNDGTPDCLDACPSDPFKIALGACGCGIEDIDNDGDGFFACLEQCDNDSNKQLPGACGCGTPDTDSDLDSVPDCNDLCPGFDDANDTDGDGTPNGCDLCPGSNDSDDQDGDGIPDNCDNCPTTANADQMNADGDANGDACDLCPGFDDSLDGDGDTIPDQCDNCPTTANLDQSDVDQDGTGDVCEALGARWIAGNDCGLFLSDFGGTRWEYITSVNVPQAIIDARTTPYTSTKGPFEGEGQFELIKDANDFIVSVGGVTEEPFLPFATSADNGASFSRLAVSDVACSEVPTSHTTLTIGGAFSGGVFWAAGEDQRVFRSTDGLTWSLVANGLNHDGTGGGCGSFGPIGLAPQSCPALGYSPADSICGDGTYYAISEGGANNKVMLGMDNGRIVRSLDGGMSFSTVSNAGRNYSNVRGLASDGNTSWVAIGQDILGNNGTPTHVVFSEDDGATWNPLDIERFSPTLYSSNNPLQSRFANDIIYMPFGAQDRFVIGGAQGTIVYSDPNSVSLGSGWEAIRDNPLRAGIGLDPAFETGEWLDPAGISRLSYNDDADLLLAIREDGFVATYSPTTDTWSAAVKATVTHPLPECQNLENITSLTTISEPQSGPVVGTPAPLPQPTFSGNDPITFATSFLMDLGSLDMTHVEVADLDGDGLQDMVIAEDRGGSPRLWSINVYKGTLANLPLQEQVAARSNDSTVLFERILVANNIYGMHSFKLADMTNDGILDIVAPGITETSDGLTTVSITNVYPGNGDGTFGQSVFEIGVGNGPIDVEVMNLNGDASLDAVVVSAAGTQVDVLFGDGSGGFSVEQTYTIPSGFGFEFVRVMHQADLNNDTLPDLLFASGASNQIVTMLNTGGGTFSNAIVTPSTRQLFNGTPFDYNGDGTVDLVAGTGESGRSFVVFQGNGAGGFTQVGEVVFGDRPIAVTPRDLNQDGFDDVIVGDEELEIILFYESNGDGTFTKTEIHDAQDMQQIIYVDNMFNDGNPALVNVEEESDDLQIIPLSGATEVIKESIASIFVARDLQGFGAADFNGDGFLDIVGGNGSPPQFIIAFGDGVGGLTNNTIYDARLLPGGEPVIESLVAGDINVDGFADIAYTTSEGVLVVLEGNGDGTFDVGSQTIIRGEVLRTVLEDLNGDGAPDMLVTGLNLEELSNFLGFFRSGCDNNTNPDCDPCYTENLFCFSQCSDTTLCSTDSPTDGGGVSPVLQSLRGFIVLLNDGKGHFSQQQIFEGPGLSGGIDFAIGDYNEDSHPDIAFTDFQDIHLFLGDGTGQFTSGNVLLPGTITSEELVTSDLNDDGHLDLIMGSSNDSVTVIFLGAGDGTFTLHDTIQPGGPRPLGIVVYDVNDDGNEDLVLSNTNLEFNVHFGDGTGSFEDEPSLSTQVTSFLIEFIPWDINLDGIVDFFGAARDGKLVAVPMLPAEPLPPAPDPTPTPMPTLFPEIGF